MHDTRFLHTKIQGRPQAKRIASVLILPFLLFFGDPSFSYEVVTVLNGGHISGNVRLGGPLPQPKRYNLVTSPDPYYCGRVSDGKGWRIAPRVLPGSDQGVPNVIVYLQGIDFGKPFEMPEQSIKAKNCRFSPYVSVFRKDKTLVFENWDPLPHKIEIFKASTKGGQLLASSNLKRNPHIRKSDFLISGKEGEHLPGKPFSFTFREEGQMIFRCSYHEYMEAWGIVLTHPYFSITSETGHYSITDIPPGTFRLVLYHPMGQIETTVQIRDEQSLKMDLELPIISPNLYQEDAPRPNPYGIDLTGDRHIVPTVELQEWPPDEFEAKD